jgi:hypothetical protein
MVSKSRIILTLTVLAVIAVGIYFLLFYKTQEKTFTIIDPQSSKPHIYTYKSLPPEFFHAGRTLIFKSPSEATTSSIAQKALSFTGYYKASRLEKAIAEYNKISRGNVAAGKPVLIPYSLPSLMPQMRNRMKSSIIVTRGLYYTGSQAGSEKLLSQIDMIADSGINTIVFDAKDVSGIVNYNSRIPEVNELGTNSKRTIDDIDKFIRAFKAHNIYVIARVAIFRDQMLSQKAPEYAIRSKSTGKVWNEGTNEVWCDPSNRDTQDYNLAIAAELAEKGVDEIQFDYIRFPTSGNLGDARFAWSFGVMQRDKCIEQFLERAHQEISSRNTNFSIDVFGIVAWGHEPDIMKTGQRIELLSKYCDVISPMLYPSHFSDNFDGYPRPGDEPYYFINTGCKKFQARAGTTPIRPWLQAFGWRVSNYNPQYIIDQIRGSNDARALGYLFWNASNNYDTVFKALKEIKDSSRNKISRTERSDGSGSLEGMNPNEKRKTD